MTALDVGVYVPQIGFTFADMLHRAEKCEELGIGSGSAPSGSGDAAAATAPIVVGGVGEKCTLPLVARFADLWNVSTYALGDLEHKVAVLRSLCAEIGTPRQIVDRIGEWEALGFGQIVLLTHDRPSDATLDLLASKVLGEL